MKIAIVGAGAMGGLFGARLALAGQDVSFVEASETTIEVISRQGLRLETPDVQESVWVPISRAHQVTGHFDLQVSRNRVAAPGYNGGILLVQEGADQTASPEQDQ